MPLAGVASTDQDWNLFPLEQEIRLGQELDAWVVARARRPTVNDIQAPVDRVAARLVQAVASPFNPAVLAFGEAEPYAFGAPGGNLYLSAGLLGRLECEHELAGLIAHELAHVELRQVTRKYSHAKRFALQAALVAAERGEATLMEALEAIGLDPHPGSPWYRFGVEEESAALAAAAARLEAAGYPPGAGEDLLQRLRERAGDDARRYLERHPSPTEAEARSGAETGSTRCRASRELSRLARAARRTSGDAGALDTLLAWSPPVSEPVAARVRERYIGRSYSFDYPGSWIPVQAGPGETIEVAPKGGRIRAGGQPSRLVLGLVAGTLEPRGGDLVCADTLAASLPELHPGLSVDALAVEPQAEAPMVYGAWLDAVSPTGAAQRVWALCRRLPDRVFYLLLVAPADQLERHLAEFHAIGASIEFSGPPALGRPAAPGQEGDIP